MDKASSMYQYAKLNRDANRFCPIESKNCMHSYSYEQRKLSASRRAQFVPTGMPTTCTCWKKIFPAKTTKILFTETTAS